MTIKLLQAWNGYAAGSILNTGDRATEAALVAQFTATYDTTGGTVPPRDQFSATDLQAGPTGLTAAQIAAGATGVVAQTNGGSQIGPDGSPVSGGGTAGGGGYVELPAPADIDGMGLRSLYQWTLLTIPSPYSPGHVLHPSLVYFVDGWNGWRYWMAYTPYPNSASEYENPCICASNDGVNFVAMGAQPIIPRPDNTGYNSDTELVFDAPNNRLLMLYRQKALPDLLQKLWMVHTTDGITWSTPQLIFTSDTSYTLTATDLLSPSMIWNASSGKWEIWGFLNRSALGDNNFGRITSSGSDPYAGWDTTPTVITFTPPSGRDWWHGTVRRMSSGSYIALIQDNDGTNGGNGNLYIAYSADGSSGSWSYKLFDTGVGKGYLWYRPAFLLRYDGVNEPVVDVYGSRLNTTGLFYQRCRIKRPSPYPERAIEVSAMLAGAAIGGVRGMLAADSFNRADSAVSLGAATSGQAWTTDTGTWGISTNRAYIATTSNSRAYIDVGTSNYVVGMTLATAGTQQWMVLRYSAATNYIRVGYASGDQLRFQVISAGSVTVDVALGVTPASGDEIVVSCIGPEHVIYLNGVRVAKQLYAPFAANTKVGLQSSGATSPYIENYVVQSVQ